MNEIFVGKKDKLKFCFKTSFNGHNKDSINQLFYFEKLRRISSCAGDGKLIIWDVESCKCLKVINFRVGGDEPGMSVFSYQWSGDILLVAEKGKISSISVRSPFLELISIDTNEKDYYKVITKLDDDRFMVFHKESYSFDVYSYAKEKFLKSVMKGLNLCWKHGPNILVKSDFYKHGVYFSLGDFDLPIIVCDYEDEKVLASFPCQGLCTPLSVYFSEKRGEEMVVIHQILLGDVGFYVGSTSTGDTIRLLLFDTGWMCVSQPALLGNYFVIGKRDYHKKLCSLHILEFDFEKLKGKECFSQQLGEVDLLVDELLVFRFYRNPISLGGKVKLLMNLRDGSEKKHDIRVLDVEGMKFGSKSEYSDLKERILFLSDELLDGELGIQKILLNFCAGGKIRIIKILFCL